MKSKKCTKKYKLAKEASLTFLIFAIIVSSSLLSINIIVGGLLRMASGQTLRMIESNIENTLTSVSLVFENTTYFISDKIKNGMDNEQLLVEMVNISEWVAASEYRMFSSEGFYGYLRGEFLDGGGWVPDDDYDPTTRPWYKNAKESNGKIVISAPYVDAQTGDLITSGSQEMFDIYGNSIGVFAIDAILDELFDYLNDLTYHENVSVFLLDSDLNITLHIDDAVPGMHLSEYSLEFYNYVSGYGDMDSVIIRNAKSDRHGEKYVFSILQMENGWLIATAVPHGVYYENIYIIVLIMVIFGLLGFGMTAFFLYTLHTQRKLATEANMSKSSFLTTMSHEIRTPMNAIIGISEMELEQEHLSQQTRDSINRIYNSGHTLLAIINDILDLSKIETGKFELILVKYETASLINDTVQLNSMRLGNKPLCFLTKVNESLPRILFGDELRIKQILNNLLSNAIKYTASGSVMLEADYEENEGVPVLIFSVHDTGQGMTKEQLIAIYDEYSMFNTEANRALEGTGLGMNITRNLISMMGGKIEIKSKLGAGSVFTVHIPQKSVGSEAIGKELADNLENFKLAGKSLKTNIIREYMPYGKILIVDDIEANLFVARGLMKPYGLTIETAESGYIAVSKVVDFGNVYDVIFMDHMMPGMDGKEATTLLRNAGYKHPIVALTANAIVGQKEIFLEEGFDDFITKPVDIRQLDAVLNEWVRDKQPPEVIAEARSKNMLPPANTPVACADANTIARLKTINELDADAALEAMSGLQDVYLDTVKITVRLLPERMKKMDGCVDSDILAFTTEVHGIKSVLRNIGATEAGDNAARLEHAALENNIDYCRDGYPPFRAILSDLVNKLNAALQVEAEEKKEAADKSSLANILGELKAAAESYDSLAAIEIISPHVGFSYGESIDELVKEITNALEAFDCEDASEKINQLQEAIANE